MATVAIVDALQRGWLVSLGLESPLVLPVPDDWEHLGRRRVGEGNRPWSAGAGATILGSGLVQLSWILGRVKSLASVSVTTQPARWSADIPLLLWEAFVSGSAKTRDDNGGNAADASAAAAAFIDCLDHLAQPGSIHVGAHQPFNLAAAAALHAGVKIDPAELALSPRIVQAVLRQ